MPEKTKIEWTDHTFNGWWGCRRVSPGCLNCYADREATRHGFPGQFGKDADHREFGEDHWNEPLKWAKRAAKEGVRRRVFCSSMADVGEDHPTAEKNRPRLFRLIEDTPELDWLVLTKRVETARSWLPPEWLKNWPAQVWFGFSAEDQKRYDERRRFALRVPAGVRFCSYEPALGPIDFGFAGVLKRQKPEGFDGWSAERQDRAIAAAARAEYIARTETIDWLIAGGESGPRSRPSHPEWFRSARDQATAAGVAFFFKQWGEWSPGYAEHGNDLGYASIATARQSEWPEGYASFLVGKKTAGRLLDGRLWDEFPTDRKTI